MTRRTSSRRTVWVPSNSAPAVTSVPLKRALISAETAAIRVASRRWAPPKSVRARPQPQAEEHRRPRRAQQLFEPPHVNDRG
jgi:hypothetical protein